MKCSRSTMKLLLIWHMRVPRLMKALKVVVKWAGSVKRAMEGGDL